ncbi:cupin domain-containing protein [Streptomyces castrisilvae]|uniref:Cupin domain-containing protein n=1 Tax=Streptomyces castrisilvae TaxID=3033811 RepID=A0ABY9HN83_9ACTN|nr:cupin domain-containing protein [Streptomyces sp. Mut1]WLQ36000.1 cupin domain-containing protein [Streptomyces sp. Mut1]
MSLSLLLPEEGVSALLNSWPNEPAVFERGSTALDRAVTPDVIDHYIDTGCVPADEIALVKSGPSLHPDCHRTNGRTDPAKLHKLYGDGYTIRLGNLQRVVPFLADMARVIQQETGYSNYLHAFLTPPRSQGLLHHWDQQMAVIAQIEGEKQWQLWRPEYSAPMREYQESFRVWNPEFIPKWEAAGPDAEVDLKPGQSLLLPRGWIHNPHALDSDERSVHLTFAIRERTPLWIAEKLIAAAIEDPAFRRVVLPEHLLSPTGLASRVQEVRKALVAYLEGVDVDQIAPVLRQTALTELEYTT